jgi:hypothetical protein
MSGAMVVNLFAAQITIKAGWENRDHFLHESIRYNQLTL